MFTVSELTKSAHDPTKPGLVRHKDYVTLLILYRQVLQRHYVIIQLLSGL